MADFSGDRTSLELYLKSIAGQFYVYELLRPSGEVFYVGKGINRRVVEHELEADRNHPSGESNPFKCNVIRQIKRRGGQIGYRVVQVFEPAEETACLALETKLIGQYRRRHEGGCLTNLAAGKGSPSGASPWSTAKHAATLSGAPKDNPERATLNSFLQGIGAVSSVPIKPLSQIARLLPTLPHPKPRKPTLRCACALVASAAAHGMPLHPGMRIPRSFEYGGVLGVIENGVSRDLVKANMASLVEASDPLREAFVLDNRQVDLLISLVGLDRLEAIGLT